MKSEKDLKQEIKLHIYSWERQRTWLFKSRPTCIFASAMICGLDFDMLKSKSSHLSNDHILLLQLTHRLLQHIKTTQRNCIISGWRQISQNNIKPNLTPLERRYDFFYLVELPLNWLKLKTLSWWAHANTKYKLNKSKCKRQTSNIQRGKAGRSKHRQQIIIIVN